MLNQVILVGKVFEIKNNNIILEIKGIESKQKDYIAIDLMGSIAKNCEKLLKKGTVVGVKGRVYTGNKIIAEKISFLSSSNK